MITKKQKNKIQLLNTPNDRIKITEELVSECEDRSIKIIQFEKQRKKINNNKSLREQWENTKRCNIDVIAVPGEEKSAIMKK